MELIIRVADTAGRAPVNHKFDTSRLTIGRAFDNDLILNDPAVSPHHAVIEVDESGYLILKDLDSLNGIYMDHHQRVEGSVGLKSGSQFIIGKTHLYLYTPGHPVEEAVRIEKTSRVSEQLGNPAVLIAALLIVSMVHAMEQWLNMFGEFKWQDIVNIELVVLGGVLLVGIFWSVVGRIFRHETNFRKQVTVILVFVLAQFMLSKFFDFMLFNTLNYYLSLVVMLFLEFILISILLWFNLCLATNQTSMQRRRTALVIALILISLSVYTELSFNDEFSDRPNYVKKLEPPWLRLAGAVSEDDYLSDVASVFEKLELE